MDCGSPDPVSCLSWREGEHLSKPAVLEERAHQDCLLTCTPGWKRRGEEQQKKMPLGREEERNRVSFPVENANSTSTCCCPQKSGYGAVLCAWDRSSYKQKCCTLVSACCSLLTLWSICGDRGEAERR